MTTLTEDEVAAINAFPVDRIQKIPTGKSAFEYRYIWVPSPCSTEDENATGFLAAVNADGSRMTIEQNRDRFSGKGDYAKSNGLSKKLEEGAKKRERIKAAIDAGCLTYAEINRATGYPNGTIAWHIQRLDINMKQLKRKAAK